MRKPEIMYIEAQRKTESFEPVNRKAVSKLPNELVLLYSIQYKRMAHEIFRYLQNKKQSPSPCNITAYRQILGCAKLSEKEKQSPILLVGSGRFHALSMALQTQQPIYIYNRGIEKLSDSDIKKLRQKRQAALVKFLAASKVGVIVSTKPGQNRMKDALKLKKQLENKGKSTYIFISDIINPSELENFQLDSWVNTACPGLAFDSPKIVNIDEIPKDFV